MRKALIILLFICFYNFVRSQSIVQRSSTAITEQDGRLSAQLNLYVPRYLDTVQASLTINIGIDTCGALIFTYSDNSYWMRVCAPTKHWVKLLKTGDVAATIWGSITGTLSNQTDLQNALNLKFNISDTTNKWVQNVYSRNDSLFKLKNGFESYLGRIGRDSVNNGLSTSGDKIQLGSNSTSGADLIHNTYINQQSKLFQIIDNGDVTFKSDPLNASYQLGKNNTNGSYISLDSNSSQFNIVASNAHYINMNGIASEFKVIMQGGFAFLDLDAGNETYKIGDISSFGSGNNTYLNVDDANAGFTFNTGGARKALLSNTGQWTWDGYPALTQQTDTTNNKPLGYNTTTGLIQPMANWASSAVTLTATQVGFGSPSNQLTSESALTYDATSNTLATDSVFLNKKLKFNGNVGSISNNNYASIQFGEGDNYFRNTENSTVTTGILSKIYQKNSCDTCTFNQPFYSAISTTLYDISQPINPVYDILAYGNGSTALPLFRIAAEQNFYNTWELHLPEFKIRNSLNRIRPISMAGNWTTGTTNIIYRQDVNTWLNSKGTINYGAITPYSAVLQPAYSIEQGLGRVAAKVIDSTTANPIGGWDIDVQNISSAYKSTWSLYGQNILLNSTSGLSFVSASINPDANSNYYFQGNNSGDLFKLANASQDVMRVYNTGSIDRICNSTGAITFYQENTNGGSGAHSVIRLLSNGSGNPYLQYYINGTAKAMWEGIDNADGDKFKMTWDGSAFPGSGTFLTADQTGRIGLKTSSPVFGLDINESIGATKDSIPHITAISTNELLTLDTATRQFKRILPSDIGFSTYTFNSGLTNTSSTVRWNGTLLESPTIDGGSSFFPTFTSTRTGANSTLIVNNTSSGHALVATASGTGYGLYGIGFNGVHGVSTTGIGVYGNATSGSGLYGDVSTGTPLTLLQNPTSSNDVQYAEVISRTTSTNSGFGANGIGTGLIFGAPTTTSTAANQGGSIEWLWSDATHASRTGRFNIRLVNNAGSLTTIATFDGNANVTFGTTNSIVGTATNNNAVAGNIGESVESYTTTYTNYTTTATYQAIDSITLTAGDWIIDAQATFSTNGATITGSADAIFVISTTRASASGALEGKNIAYISEANLAGTNHESISISPYRVSLSGTTKYYLNSQASFTLGNPQYAGGLHGTRPR